MTISQCQCLTTLILWFFSKTFKLNLVFVFILSPFRILNQFQPLNWECFKLSCVFAPSARYKKSHHRKTAINNGNNNTKKKKKPKKNNKIKSARVINFHLMGISVDRLDILFLIVSAAQHRAGQVSFLCAGFSVLFFILRFSFVCLLMIHS